MSGDALPRVGVLALGGTIASVVSDASGVAPSLPAEQLVRSVPALAGTADIEAATFRQVPSPQIPPRWIGSPGVTFCVYQVFPPS